MRRSASSASAGAASRPPAASCSTSSPPTFGSVEFGGERVTGRKGADMIAMRRRLQIVFQDPYASLNPRRTVGQTLADPLQVHYGWDRERVDARVAELLDRVGLSPEHAKRFPHEFSGGRRQRVGIARALTLAPDLIVLDEPVSALDVSIQAGVVNLLSEPTWVSPTSSSPTTSRSCATSVTASR